MYPHSRFWVVSSIVMDVVTRINQWPERSGDVVAQSGFATPGGAFNVIAAARRLGMDTIYGGLMGTGAFGHMIQQHLRRIHVDWALRPVRDADTGFVVAVVEPDGERTFITVPGCEAHLTLANLSALPVYPDDVVYISGYSLVAEPSASAFARWMTSRQQNVVVLDPGPLIAEIAPEFLTSLIPHVDILTLNRREAHLISGHTHPADALMSIKQRFRVGNRSRILVRSGADGTWISDANGAPQRIPSRAARVVDTTGAGDVHTGALVTRMRHVPFPRAVFEANVAASIAVERLGPSESPTALELAQCLQEIDQKEC